MLAVVFSAKKKRRRVAMKRRYQIEQQRAVRNDAASLASKNSGITETDWQ
jgi:hypothetical protein